MLTRSAARTASALALTALLAACGDTHTTAPNDADFRNPTPQFNAVELLITIISGGGGGPTTGTNPPSFSLSSVPTSIDAGTAWSRTIAVDPHGPFAPAMAVDYGDGAGPRSLNVAQSGGELIFNPTTGQMTQTPISYSFTLSHTYATAGTYTVTVVAATNVDGQSSRFATATITVAPDPRLYIENFQIATPVIQGQAAAYSFDALGPPGGLYAVTMTYGTNLTEQSAVAANGTYSSSHTWAAPGTYELSATISNGDRSATLTREVVVQAAPIVISSFVGQENVSYGEEASFSFMAVGPGPGPYTATITYGDGSEPTVLSIVPGTTVTRTHTWAESGLWPLSIVVDNGFVSATLNEAVPIYRPRPTVDDLSIPETLHFGQEAVLYFVPNDASAVERMAYEIVVSLEDESSSMSELTPRGVPVELPIQAPDFAGVYEIRIVVHSVLNGLVLTSDTAFHTLTVEDLVCAAGSYRDGFGCVDAPAGSYVPEAGALEATPCPVGTYQDQAGQTSCIPAPAGSFVPATGAAQAQLCPAGSWQDQPGSAACNLAQPGHFVSQAGATQSTACAPATFQPAAGSTSCNAAAPGSYVSTSGATQATLCSPGTYQPASGQTGCVEAPTGSYVDVAGAVAATPCPVTTSTTGTGSTSAAQCIALGQIALLEIGQAVGDGTLVPAAAGTGGQQQFGAWLADLNRSFAFLEGPQRKAGCMGVRNALALADGNPSPLDVVTGPARAGVEAALRRILDEYGC